MNFLFVCTGNTCRSPLAEALARVIAEKKDLPHTFASAGIATHDGLTASTGALDAAEAWQADLTEHRSRQLTRSMLEEADVVLTMTAGQRGLLRREFADQAEKVFTLTEYAHQTGDIEDPYGQDSDVYLTVARQIAGALVRILIPDGGEEA